MRVWVTALLMVLVALAGCTEDSQPNEADHGMGDDEHMDGGGQMDSDPSDETSDGDSGEPSDEESPNTPPAADFAPDATTGEAPADIMFSFNASDAESTELTWTLDANGDGVAEATGNENNLPGNFTFTFSEAGEYVAEFVVSDGEMNHTINELITITAPAGPEPEPEAPPQFEDRGFYLYEYETGQCHAKDYTEEVPGLVYASSTELGGDWNFVETNGAEGLQFQDNHPLGGGQGLFFDLPVATDCVDGDQTAT